MKVRLIIGILSIIGGMFFFVKALGISKNVGAGADWLSVEGKVIKSELTSTWSSNAGGVNYHLNIEYVYTVNGKDFTSDVVAFGGVLDGNFPKMRKRYIERYPKGGVVKVYYDPAKPENAVLEPNENIAIFYYVVASVFVLLGIVFVSNFFTGFGEGFITTFFGEN